MSTAPDQMITLQPGTMTMSVDLSPAVELRDATVSVQRALSYDPAAPVVLLVGSALEFQEGRGLISSDEAAQVAAQVATVLAEARCNVLNGACPGLPDLVMNAYNALERRGTSIGVSGYWNEHQHREDKPFAAGFPVAADLTVFSGAGFEMLDVINTLVADVVIVFGGGLGTLIEAAAAVEQEIPTLALVATGGMAERMGPLFSQSIAEFKGYSLEEIDTVDRLAIRLSEITRQMSDENRASRMSPMIIDIDREVRDRSSRTVEIDISRGASSVTYRAPGGAHTLKGPALLIDRPRIVKESASPETLLHALQYYTRRYLYDGGVVELSPSQDTLVWGPSIDSVLLLEAARKVARTMSVDTVTDVGAGSGFMGLWFAAAELAARVQVIDRNPSALQCVRQNLARRPSPDGVEVVVAGSIAEPVITRADLLLCNPPYIPFPRASDEQPQSPYGGTELLIELLDHRDTYLTTGGVGLCVLSSTSLRNPAVAGRVQAGIADGTIHEVRSEVVPLKLGDIQNDPAWIEALTADQGLVHRPESEHPWWHEITILQIAAA